MTEIARRENLANMTAAPGMVLEIGVGAYPWHPRPTMLIEDDPSNPKRYFGDGSAYVGIDMPDDPNRYWVHFMAGEEPRTQPTKADRLQVRENLRVAQDFFRRVRPDEHISFMAADGHDLPFPDGTFDEVFCGNVYGSQLVGDSQRAMTSEIRRVLKPAGRLVVHETITPHWAYDPDFAGDTFLPDLLKDCGLPIEEVALVGSDRYAGYLAVYGASAEDITGDADLNQAYFIQARLTA